MYATTQEVLKRMAGTVAPADSSDASADSFRGNYIENDTTFFSRKDDNTIDSMYSDEF